MGDKTYEYKTVTARFGTPKHDKQLNQAAAEGYVLVAEAGNSWHTLANMRRERGAIPADFVHEYKSIVTRISRTKQHVAAMNKATLAGFEVDADVVNGRARYTRLRRKVAAKDATSKRPRASLIGIFLRRK